MQEAYEMSPEERTQLEKLTPRPHGLVPGTLEYQEYFNRGTSSLSVLQEKQKTEIGKLSDKIDKLEKSANLSEGDKVRLTDYRVNLKELTQKELELTKKLNSIHTLSK